MASSIRLPSPGASYRFTAMLADFGAVFSMALVVCLCGVLIAGLEMVSAQMRSVAQAKAMAAARKQAAEQEFNARYYPLIDCRLFRIPKLRRFIWFPPEVILAEPPDLEHITIEDLCPMRPLYPVSFPAESYGSLPAIGQEARVFGGEA